jgi:8-oxo-dGTP pyrophosphatase MutT (NUDIX family)
MESIPPPVSDFQSICHQLAQRSLPLLSLPVEPERIRQAAVTLLLRDGAGAAELLIIKRAEHPSDPWSGHLALPGGRADATDEHLIATAARETFEEVGVRLSLSESFIGRLETYAPRNPQLPQIEITPLIALAPPEINLQMSQEVADAFWMPVRELKEVGLADEFPWQFGELIVKRPAYPSPRGPIWGITERILTTFFSLID